MHDLANGRHVGRLGPAAQRIGEKLLGHRDGERVSPGEQRLSKRDVIGELTAVERPPTDR